MTVFFSRDVHLIGVRWCISPARDVRVSRLRRTSHASHTVRLNLLARTVSIRSRARFSPLSLCFLIIAFSPFSGIGGAVSQSVRLNPTPFSAAFSRVQYQLWTLLKSKALNSHSSLTSINEEAEPC